MVKSLSAITLALLVGTAQAQPQVLEIVGSPLRAVTSDEAAEVRGAYDMSDGRSMVVRQRGKRLLVALEGLPETEVMAASGRRMLTSDRHMELVFDTNGYGQHVKVVLTGPMAIAANGPAVLAGMTR